MTSTKGFLARVVGTTGKIGRPRLSAAQKRMVASAIREVMLHHEDTLPGGAMDADGTGSVAWHQSSLAEKVVQSAIHAYPTDRSCHTCDLYHGVTCQHWKREVPDHAVEAGCDHHQDDGVPF